MFGREYVKTGEAPPAWGQALRQTLKLRGQALYDTLAELNAQDAQPVIDLAHDLLGFLTRKLEETQSGDTN